MDRIFHILSGADTEMIDINIVKKEKQRKKKIKSIKIEPVIKIKNDYTDPPHPNLLRMPFSLLLFAPKGSGKTTLLHNVLTWYIHLFDMIFILVSYRFIQPFQFDNDTFHCTAVGGIDNISIYPLFQYRVTVNS